MTCPHCNTQHPRSVNHNACATQDDRAVAYHAGAADARNGRPRRVDPADRGQTGDAYHRGYDDALEETDE